MDPTDALLTPRLVLTPVEPGDVEDLVRLYADPEVGYWTGPWTRTSITAWANGMARRWSEDGIGKWMVRRRVDGALVGRGGLSHFDLAGESVLEVGWVVRDALTGRGYATEIGRAALNWADEHERGMPVIAFTEVHNHASLSVMRRLGMLPAGVIHRNGLVQGRQGSHPDAPFAVYRYR